MADNDAAKLEKFERTVKEVYDSIQIETMKIPPYAGVDQVTMTPIEYELSNMEDLLLWIEHKLKPLLEGR